MSFSYNDYQFHCLILPASILLFSAVVFIVASIWSIRDIVRKGPTAEKVLTLLFFLFLAGAFFRIDGGRLLNGGLYLLREKAAEAVTYEGIIEGISLYEQTQFPNISSQYREYRDENRENGYGYEIVVDKRTLKAPQIGTLNVGDRVSVTCLPKSGYILSIEKTTEAVPCYDLFDTEAQIEQNEETGPSIIEKNGLYSIHIVDPKGVPLAEYGPYGKEPTIEEVGKLQAVSLQTGTGDAARWTIYYDPRTGQLSEPFMGVLNTDGKLVVYIAPDGKAVCVREIFGQYYERFEAFSEDLASTAEPFVGAELCEDEQSLVLTYLAGNDYHKTTERIELQRELRLQE